MNGKSSLTLNPTKYSCWWAMIIGVGLALFPIHNKWLTDTTSIDGQATLFLPAIGTVMWIMATLLFLLDNWRETDWGDRRIFVPLLIIVGAIGLSGITADTWAGKVAPLFMGVSLFALYLVSRVLGKDMFLPLAIGAAIASLGIITYGVWHSGQATGGFVFELNFDIATGFILLGAALFVHRWQWLLAGLSVLSLLFSGAPEAVFALGVLTLVVLVRRDWSRRLVIVFVVIVVIATVGLLGGWAQKLYSYTFATINNAPVAVYSPPNNEDNGGNLKVSPLVIRVLVARDAITNISLLGDGYNLTQFATKTVHNVPLVIVQQLGWAGVLAGVAWLWVSVFCLIKTRWKYVWILILTLSVFDHYLWTQLAPFWWCVVGASTTSRIRNDLVFRRIK